MRFAYADPPYLGQGRRHYAKHHADAARWDALHAHSFLIAQLEEYDGWALSLNSPTLETMLHLCRTILGPNKVRVGAWVKPFAAFKPGVNPAYTWEPVIFVPAPLKRARTDPTTRDYVEAEDVDAVKANITLKRGLAGAKPDPFCDWLIPLLGITKHDTLDDLFPGTGAVTRAWERWKAKQEEAA